MGMLNVLVALGVVLGTPGQPETLPDQLVVSTEMHFSDEPSGSGGSSWGRLVVGQRTKWVAFMDRGCGFNAGYKEFSPTASFGWQVEAIPTAITSAHAVILLRWARALDRGKRSASEGREMTVVLRPGEHLSLDLWDLPGTADGLAPCRVGSDSRRHVSASLSVTLRTKEPARPRVVSTNVWLVHRRPGGQESTQALNIRGAFDAELPFFFDGVKVGSSVLDVSGMIRPRSQAGDLISLEFSAERRLTSGDLHPDTRYVGNGDVVISTGPKGVTEYEIPFGTSKGWEAFAGHSLAVRVQSARLR